MGPTRTQIYLTDRQRKALDARRRRERKTLAAVVGDAIDAYIGVPATANAQRIVDESFGAIPDFKIQPRDSWQKRERRLGLGG